MRNCLTVVLVALGANCATAQDSGAAKEWVRETDDYFPENVPRDPSGRPTMIIKQIVDADSGVPVAGATLDVIHGRQDREREDVAKRTAITDRDGWARVRVDDLRADGTWLYAQGDARGHEPRCVQEGGMADEGWLEVVPAPDLAVDVVDRVGHPIGGATAVYAYFRRFPLRTGVTNSAGRAVLHACRGPNPNAANFFVVKDGKDLDAVVAEVPAEPGTSRLLLHCLQSGGDPRESSTRPGHTRVELTILFEDVPRDATVQVISDDAVDPIPLPYSGESSLSVGVPAEGPCAISVATRTRTQIVEVTEAARTPATRASRPGSVVVRWVRPSTLRFRLAGPDGTPVAGRAGVNWNFAEVTQEIFDPAEAKQVHEIATQLRGPVWLTARAIDPALRTVSRRVVLDQEGAVHDLGEIRFRRKADSFVRILRPDGSPAPDTRVILRHFGHLRGWLNTEDDGTLRESDWWSFEPMAGLQLQIDFIGETEARSLPIAFYRKPEGVGPWTMAWPRAEIDLSVQDPQGRPVDRFFARLDRFRLEGQQGNLRIPGVEPGPHRLVIVAPGFRARVEQIQLRQDERRTVSAVLHLLPEAETQPTSRPR